MKYVDEFRDRKLCQTVLDRILSRVTRCWTIMEVCGGQTHGLLRFGIEEALRDKVELIHGPGCPVCVTSATAIDAAIKLSFQPNTLVLTFGDMLRVPGSDLSLQQAKALGGNIQTVYSPMDAISTASLLPDKRIVFFAVGFETTLPATAIALLQAADKRLSNFFVLMSHVRVAPAMQYILEQPDCRIDGFLAAGHVCTVIGIQDCVQLSEEFGIPIVVTGFEPLDLLLGIEECVSLLERDQGGVANHYRRVVADEGNTMAQSLIAEVFEIDDQEWRGLGQVRSGGYRLREKYQAIDAAKLLGEFKPAKLHIGFSDCTNRQPNDCRSAEVLIGKIKPTECPHFGKGCKPQSPMGAPMVSSEGACAAYFQYTNFEPFDSEKTNAGDGHGGD
jgi:hydrogenase expression/formation protein HypD